jgi:hypothetical protein
VQALEDVFAKAGPRVSPAALTQAATALSGMLGDEDDSTRSYAAAAMGEHFIYC